jgi:regulator of sigma E protease
VIASIAYIFLAVFVFLVMISLLIFIHELGHYSVGRLLGIKVERFSIGFGKPLFKHTAKSGTEWTISQLPLGGYVKFAGDAGAASTPDTEALDAMRSEHDDVSDIFHFRPVWQRALVVLAGPMANFILAALLFALALMWVGERTRPAVIGSVVDGSPAAMAGLQPGDQIAKMDGKPIESWSDMVQHIVLRADTPVSVTFTRNGFEQDVMVIPSRVETKDFVGGAMTKGFFGVGPDTDVPAQFQKSGPIEAIAGGTEKVAETLGMTGTYISRIFAGKEDGKQLGSIFRIATITGKSTTDIARMEQPVSVRLKAFFHTMLILGAGISVALGFANLLPIPMLDGGHLLFYSYEALAGKPLPLPVQEAGYRLGMLLIFGLFVVLTINDIGYFGSISFQG